ncbi:hypothetical protein HMPREF9069_00662 [Atopobium sp. oral taxon 810 str. F0209]|nr:hypothetical protein HMPREF9069_00662 [Atopobium sp. oral taxon 810 str. F0209]
MFDAGDVQLLVNCCPFLHYAYIQKTQTSSLLYNAARHAN